MIRKEPKANHLWLPYTELSLEQIHNGLYPSGTVALSIFHSLSDLTNIKVVEPLCPMSDQFTITVLSTPGTIDITREGVASPSYIPDLKSQVA